jgi:hypothetical protein
MSTGLVTSAGFSSVLTLSGIVIIDLTQNLFTKQLDIVCNDSSG